MTDHNETTVEAENYAVVNGWLVELVNEHTCGAGDENGHEPSCGMVPIAKVEDMLARAESPVHRLKVEHDENLTSFPCAERVNGGWQCGVHFYPDAQVVSATPLYARAKALVAAHDAALLPAAPSTVGTVEELEAALREHPPYHCVDCIDNEMDRGALGLLLTPATTRDVGATDAEIDAAAKAHRDEMHEDAQTAPTKEGVDLLRMSSFALGALWATDRDTFKYAALTTGVIVVAVAGLFGLGVWL